MKSLKSRVEKLEEKTGKAKVHPIKVLVKEPDGYFETDDEGKSKKITQQEVDELRDKGVAVIFVEFVKAKEE